MNQKNKEIIKKIEEIDADLQKRADERGIELPFSKKMKIDKTKAINMEAPKNIYQKLLEVQKEIKGIKKTESNPYFKSKYFDVNAILAELKPILNKHGLVLQQPFRVRDNGKSTLRTIVSDPVSDLSVESEIYLPESIDPQKMGSAITYYRRYALQSMFALEAEDDDGNAASSPAPKPTPYSSKSKPQEYTGDESYQ